MNTLRLLLRAPYAAGAPLPWALVDASGAHVAGGHGVASTWPQAQHVEVVIGANLVRLAAVALPPMAPGRLAAAVAYALEDQLAANGEAPVLAPSAQAADGRVVVAIVARPVLSSLREHGNAFGTLARVIAEPALATPDEGGWCWCVPDTPEPGEGFVRLADGSALPVGGRTDDALPGELLLALAQAERANASPPHVRVDAAVDDASLVRWTRETGIAFVRGTPWRWDAGSAAAHAQATNLLQGEFAPTRALPTVARRRLFAPALWILAAALILHVAATVGEWAWWRIDAWRTGRALTSLAVASGVSPADASTPAAARSALARVYAEQRHAHALPAPSDALPTLARAAPALSALAPGVLKSATYAEGHWTLDLQRVDQQVVRDLEVRLRQVGTPAVVAPTATGARLRLESN